MADFGDSNAESNRTDPLGYYMLLGIPRSSDAATIRKAYKQLSTTFHPDKFASADAESHESMKVRFQRINEAYQVLGDERSRVAYDRFGKSGLEKLALVPETAKDPQSVVQILDILKREAEVQKQAKLVGATGDVTISYNAIKARLQEEQKRQQEQQQQLQHEQELEQLMADEAEQQQQHGGHGGGNEHEFDAHKEQLQVEVSDAHPAGDHGEPADHDSDGSHHHHGHSGHDDEGAPQQEGGEAQQGMQGMQQQVQVQQVMINGQPTVVLVPQGALKEQLTAAVQQQQEAQQPQHGHGHGHAQPGMLGRQQQVSRLARLGALLVPDSISARYSFHQPVGQSAVLVFTTRSTMSQGQATVGIELDGEYHSSSVMTWFSSLKTTIQGTKFTLGFLRELSTVSKLKLQVPILDRVALLPHVTFEWARQLSDAVSLTNALRWSRGENGFFSSTLSQAQGDEDTSVLGRVTLSLASVGLVLQKSMKFTILRGTPLEAEAVAVQSIATDLLRGGRMSLSTEYWYLHDDLQRFGFGVSVNAPFLMVFSGISLTQLNLLYRRGKHKVSVPIVIGLENRATAALQALLLPPLLYRLAAAGLRPVLKVKSIRDSRMQRKANEEVLIAAMQQAEREVASLKRTVTAKSAAEEAVGGLVIVNAKYGVQRPALPEESYGSTVPLAVDVTIGLQNCVRDSQLNLPEGDRGALAGMFDPHPSASKYEEKTLKIVYSFNGRRHTAEFTDSEPIMLPNESHLVR